MAKKPSNEQKVVATLDALDKAVHILQKYGARYDRHIDEAALRGDDARAKELIKNKIRVYALIEQLNILKGNVELGGYTTQALSQLSTLPDAIAGCRGLLAESPNFTKLGRSISAIFNDIEKSEDEIAKLNSILTPKPAATSSSLLDSISEEEVSDQFKAEYAAMMERVKGAVSPESIAKPDAITDATGEIDYAGIVAEENKRK